MEVSIIIPVYKRTDWIEKCIEKLRGQDFEDTFEIIVIDNHLIKTISKVKTI